MSQSCCVVLLLAAFLFKSCLLWPDPVLKEWCSVLCNKSVFTTVCARRDTRCGLGNYRCPMVAKVMVPSQEERKTIVDLHNKYREKLAMGLLERAVFHTTASNIAVISYKKELEFQAQCWANKCEVYDNWCPLTPNYRSVGRSIFYSNTDNFTEILEDWYDQHKLWSGMNILDGFSDVSHFTQMVWAKTLYVGCGRIKYSTKQFIVVCLYAPEGNIAKKRIFIIGKPRSKCPAQSLEQSDKYKNLCGTEEPMENDNFVKPFKMRSHCNKNTIDLAVLTFAMLINA